MFLVARQMAISEAEILVNGWNYFNLNMSLRTTKKITQKVVKLKTGVPVLSNGFNEDLYIPKHIPEGRDVKSFHNKFMDFRSKLRKSLNCFKDIDQVLICLCLFNDDDLYVDKSDIENNWKVLENFYGSNKFTKDLKYGVIAMIAHEIQEEENTRSKNFLVYYFDTSYDLRDTEQELKDWIMAKPNCKSKYLITNDICVPGFECNAIIGIGKKAMGVCVSRSRAEFIEIY